MAERKRVRRNTLERRCLPKAYKRLFHGAPKSVFKRREAIKKNCALPKTIFDGRLRAAVAFRGGANI
jgi:hypothetical protein